MGETSLRHIPPYSRPESAAGQRRIAARNLGLASHRQQTGNPHERHELRRRDLDRGRRGGPWRRHRPRRAIHAEPELGLDLPKTTAKVKAALAGLPLEIREGPSTTGLVAILRGPANGRTMLLRGDMDALPLTEDTGLAFTSLNKGAMHACGHDTHVAMLAGAARALCERRDRLTGTVMFMFQPGEEGWHGARFMLEDGLLEPLPDAAFALHISPNMPTGMFASKAATLMAASDTVRIKVTGAGGHASMPQDALDPIPVLCEIVTAMQTFVTRRMSVFEPAVMTIAKIEAGTTNNVIPEDGRLVGTIRTLSERTRGEVHAGRKTVAEHVPGARGDGASGYRPRLPGHGLRPARRGSRRAHRQGACSAKPAGGPCLTR